MFHPHFFSNFFLFLVFKQPKKRLKNSRFFLPKTYK